MKSNQKKRKKVVNRTYTAPKSVSGMDNPFGETYNKKFDGKFRNRIDEDDIETLMDEAGKGLIKILSRR